MATRRQFVLAVAGLAVTLPAAAGESARLVLRGEGMELPLPPGAIEQTAVAPDAYGAPYWAVTVWLRPEAQAALAEMTAALINRPLSILWDGEEIAAPMINEVIEAGVFMISGLDELTARRIAALAGYGG